MDLLLRCTTLAASLLVGGFFAVVLLKLWTGEIALTGLLDTKEPAGRRSFSPARLQLLLFTVVVAAYYLHAILVNPQRDSLPTIPDSVVAVLAGSQAVYLGGKAITAFIQPLLKNFE